MVKGEMFERGKNIVLSGNSNVIRLFFGNGNCQQCRYPEWRGCMVFYACDYRSLRYWYFVLAVRQGKSSAFRICCF